MKSDEAHYRITELLVRLVENEISDQEIGYVQDWLTNDPDAKLQYLEFVKD